MKLRHKLLICLAVLMALDVATTVVGLSLGHGEGNPLGAALLGLGAAWLVLGAVKVAAVGFIWLAQRPLPDRWSAPLMAACNVVMATVVAWNVGVIA